ncbi:putative wall-associated receptor kinase-like 16 [Pistacia vera]|uniref:putative wall-associated receptor kinase-like 16 n=1 Tax=Pistacia vera TaxID=55513 RepID=UPI0012632755|nr:putative wall-associated receptor kinase-like 16 [Pistacia vera]
MLEKILKMIRKMWVIWVMMLLWWPTTSSNVKPGCQEKCGDVSVPFPFGIDNLYCAKNESFLLKCNRSKTPATLMFGENIATLNISIEEGIVVASIDSAMRCYNESGLMQETIFDQSIDLGGGLFRFSDTRNKLTAFGCDTLAGMGDWNGSFVSFCGSFCSDNRSVSMNITGDSCSGIGCCQTPLPKSLNSLNITLDTIENHKQCWKFNKCDYAFLADESFDISEFRQSLERRQMMKSNITIEWVAKEETCEAGKNSPDYACGRDARCVYSKNGQGYRCLCNEGFRGNPYLPEGCEDFNECEEPENYPCEGTCKNTLGNYTCSCPLGMRGDGKVGCQGYRILTIAAVAGATIFVVIIGVLAFIAFKQKKKERNFFENGGMILKNQRVRIFSEAELAKATKNYDTSQFLGEGAYGFVYKGVLPDKTQVAVKKSKEVDKTQINQEFQREIGIVSQINHKNIVKLLGLCLETKVPILVYEFISNGTLSHHIHDKRSRLLKTWKNRLKIAAEIALALDYFHCLANPPIIHGDVKSANILLDENGTAKVSDFGTSVLISPGQNLMVSKVQGTFGYLDPEYLMTGILTEKSDVYSFGVVLVELLMGMKPGSCVSYGKNINMIQYFMSSLENNSLNQVLGFEVSDDDAEMEEIEEVAELAKRCLSSSVKRPSMQEVAEELVRLKRLNYNFSAQQNNEETAKLLGESSFSNLEITQQDTHSVNLSEIDNYSDSI